MYKKMLEVSSPVSDNNYVELPDEVLKALKIKDMGTDLVFTISNGGVVTITKKDMDKKRIFDIFEAMYSASQSGTPLEIIGSNKNKVHKLLVKYLQEFDTNEKIGYMLSEESFDALGEMSFLEVEGIQSENLHDLGYNAFDLAFTDDIQPLLEKVTTIVMDGDSLENTLLISRLVESGIKVITIGKTVRNVGLPKLYSLDTDKHQLALTKVEYTGSVFTFTEQLLGEETSEK